MTRTLTREVVGTIIVVAVLVFFGLAAVNVAYGQEVTPQEKMTVEIPIDTVFRGDPGDLFLLATLTAEPGDICVAELEGFNNKSIHPDSDILVGPITFYDVESGSFAGTKAAGFTFNATGSNVVAVRLGGDGLFSAGFLLEVTCNPPTTTTMPTPSTTSTVPNGTTTSTTVAPPDVTTTTEPPPINGIDTGGGACADGVCDGSLSPLVTWIGIGVALLLAASLALALIIGGNRKDDPPYE